MHAIPTLYRGTWFRSRLEARYAAWFDLLGITPHTAVSWSYEPVDLAGYIPDFLLSIAVTEGEQTATLSMFVEIKPALTNEALKEACAKIDASGWTEHTSVSVFRVLGALPSIELRRGRPTWDPWYNDGLFRDMHEALPTHWPEAGNRVQWRGSHAQ